MLKSRTSMYARLLASDASYNGRFFVGVTTTGIYCLPGCHARKPKLVNVRFFPSCEAAREAGLRACRKCHPDDFARGADHVLETIEALVADVRSNPAAFRDARAVVRHSGFGPTRLFELLRIHYHATPAAILLNARLARARDLLTTSGAALAEIALQSGFDSLSAFHERFRQFNGLTPASFRDLRGQRTFELELPADFSLPHLRRALGRDPKSANERLEGNRYSAATRIGSEPASFSLEIEPTVARVTADPGLACEIHAVAVGLLGLGQDTAGFCRLARSLGMSRLTAGRPGLRISQTLSVFEGLLWAIIGQQINLPFACALKARLYQLAGTPMPNGLIAPPTPAAIAALDPESLKPLQYSRQKAGYLIGIARLVASGELDLESLRALSATRAERTLLAVRGLGPWSVNYLMMRSLGFADCVPLGDTGVTSGLQALFKLDERPDADGTRRLMSSFSPHRSLATSHLWQFNRPNP